jgi:tRNA(Ile)-lysidine synthase TilS/MesJ
MGTVQCDICLMTSDVVRINDSGVCEFCDLHLKLEDSYPKGEWDKILFKIKRAGRKKDYNCLIGISGGFDSSTLLWFAVNKWGLRPMVIHFDNHYNSREAEHNIRLLEKNLGIEVVRFHVDKIDYDRMNKAFLWAGVPDADIPNDMVMTSLMYETANKYGIKYILNGHDFRTEGSTPVAWTYMDAKYMEDVYKNYALGRTPTIPLFTFREQIYYTLKGIRQVRPFYYNKINLDFWKSNLINNYGFHDYKYKHGENYYTMFVGYKLLPEKFGIDKRIVYLSARIRSGKITRAQAIEKLREEITLPSEVINIAESNKHLVDRRVRDRLEFNRYNFKRYRILIWLMMKLGVVPYTFYKKYCR